MCIFEKRKWKNSFLVVFYLKKICTNMYGSNDMNEEYATRINTLIRTHPLEIDADVVLQGRVPTAASSEFLTNKEQGDWAEKLVLASINAASSQYIALPYGRSESIAAGDPGFAAFYATYLDELNTIGKRPDILIFKREDAPVDGIVDVQDSELISKAVAAIEVRSSSFLSKKYEDFMVRRETEAMASCMRLKEEILAEPYGSILAERNRETYTFLATAAPATFRELNFRAVNWSSSPELRFISEKMKEIRENIKLLHKRDFLSITPKKEDLALVNRWIQHYGVPHYYLQVFFDRGYVISFEKILEISSNPDLEGRVFSVERDAHNQGKTTIKIDISEAKLIIDEIEMPCHISRMKELERGRLLFYVMFEGGRGSLDLELMNSILS